MCIQIDHFVEYRGFDAQESAFIARHQRLRVLNFVQLTFICKESFFIENVTDAHNAANHLVSILHLAAPVKEKKH